MRPYYLRSGRHIDSGCRGGIGNAHFDSPDYELEIGNQCNASFEMLAVCIMIDEIKELIENPKPMFASLIERRLKEIETSLLEDFTASNQDKA